MRSRRGGRALRAAAAAALAAACAGARAPYNTGGARDPDAALNVHLVPHSHDDVGESFPRLRLQGRQPVSSKWRQRRRPLPGVVGGGGDGGFGRPCWAL